MASKSDGMESSYITFSSMKQPPLIKQLKGILSEYPDGGQILKEVIQNAEDAEASEVKILYDTRRIGDTTGEITPGYNRFFKGPALCIYNDGVFSEKDWDGIRMIYSSVKEDDPLTVGRFGLGFKSVFHITDYPCVISGSKMLLIDPQQDSNKVNAMIDLCRIDQDKTLHAESFWSALDGTFGFTRATAQAGYFKGTIFWFPLREKASAISETLYDEAKVLDLFDGFQSEASSILLFLKNLYKISLHIIQGDYQSKEIAKTEIEDSSGKLKQSRAIFKEKMKILSSDYKGEDLSLDIQMTIITTIRDVSETAKWLVVNYFVGNSASPEFKKLIQDESLQYSPYVGVAAPLSTTKGPLEGHVFCFLPLPREGSRLTGLPVHVNGFFALSQNRHHLKWETDEQKGKRIDDKNILWNKILIKEALPKAYSRLIQTVVDVCNHLGNDDESVITVYNTLPLISNIQSMWKTLGTELYKRAKKQKIMYSKNKNKWVTVSDACFASFDKLPEGYNNTKNAVIQCLSLLGKTHVDLPLEVFNNLKKHFQSIKDLSPDLTAKLLHQNAAYKNLSNQNKIDLLTYLFSDERYYEKVEGLELLPLATEGWTSYKTQSEPIYICSDEEVDLLKDFRQTLVRKSSSLGELLSNHIKIICEKGLFQIKKMEISIFEQFLEKTVTSQLGSSLCLTTNTKLSFGWLKNVWEYILDRDYAPHVRNAHIVPLLTRGTWDSPEAASLETLSATLLVKSCSREVLPDGVCTCFESVGIKVVGSLPDWIPKEKMKSYFFWPTQKSFIALLTKLGTGSHVNETIETFNTSSQTKDRFVFAACIAKCFHSLTDEATRLIKSLKLFSAVSSVNGKEIISSVSETGQYFIKSDEFPEGVQFPFQCLTADSSNEALLSHIGARKVDLTELVLCTLIRFQKNDTKSVTEIPKFMEYFFNKFHQFQTNQAIINAASDVRFLKVGSDRRKASDLFDPSDESLKDLLLGEALLPETKKRLNNEKIRILNFLGLRSVRDITADIVFQVGKTLDKWSKEGLEEIQCLKKAGALMNLLQSNPTLLHEKCHNGKSLADCLKTLSCIPVESKRLPPYPECVHWLSEYIVLCKPTDAKEACFSLLVGASVPIVSCTSQQINTEFGWKQPPAIKEVIFQLRAIKDSYSVEKRPDIMPLVKVIYSHLSQRHREIWNYPQTLAIERVVWNGEDFVVPGKVIVSKQNGDIDLQPYFVFVPDEFANMPQLFSAFGCPVKQETDILLSTLQQVKEFHSSLQDAEKVSRDRKLVCNILDKLALKIKHGNISTHDHEILMMVHDDNNPNSLTLFPISECVYDDDPMFYFENDENVHFVHEMVSKSTVEALEIKSVTRRALMEAEELGVEEWGQQEPLTTRIHALLRDGYTDGLSVPKELIQNADDAGASVVRFLYDERKNTNFRNRVFNKELRSFQGPALWIFNDARFSADDIKNITKLNAATKQKDMKKIGKFGLGFCSVYNLTDLPSILSGSSLILFDPHEKHISNVLRLKGTGLKYTFPNKTLVMRHIDQFKPYASIFGCNIDKEDFQEYNGTLFRLPLRTEQQARESRICSVSYTKEEMSRLLRMFIETAGNCLLFTQNVKHLEIYHLSENASSVSEQRLLYKIEKDTVKWNQGIKTPLEESVLSRMPNLLVSQNHFSEIHKCVIRQTHTDYTKTVVGDIGEHIRDSETTWLISWAKGNGKSLRMYKSLYSKGVVPVSAVTVPCTETDDFEIFDLKSVPSGFYTEGHVFCFLPLPLKTKLPVHINGCFAVTSDRRQLASLTEDDKGSEGNAWNEALMEDSLVSAHLQLIQTIAFSSSIKQSHSQNFELWPSRCASLVIPFKNAFYKSVFETDVKVFRGNDKWVSFQNATYLDPKIRNCIFGELAFEVLSRFQPRNDKTLIEMPDYIMENIMQCNRGSENIILMAMIGEEEFFLTFFKSLHTDFWVSRLDERNTLIIAALKCQSKRVKQEMCKLRCIPTEPYNKLSRASDLIHPESFIASLYCVGDEIFPICSKDFLKDSILAKLVEIGMNTSFLPEGCLLDRCKSIATLAEICTNCAKERCYALVRYLCQDRVLNELENEKYLLKQVTEQYMFPVLSKPVEWGFSWKANKDLTEIMSWSGENVCEKHMDETETLFLGQSKHLYRQNMKDYVGIVGLLINESHILSFKENIKNAPKLFDLLGIKTLMRTPVQMIVQQVKVISGEYIDKASQFEDVSRIHEKIFLHLEKNFNSFETDGTEKNALDSLRGYPFVLIGDELVRAQNVAFFVKEEHRPQLYRLPEKDKLNKTKVYSFLGIKEHFSLETVIEALEKLKQTEGMDGNVEKVNNLMINLDEVLQNTRRSYEDIPEFHDKIIAPDVECKLWPTYQMVVENEEYISSISMKILHQSIAPSLAHNLGVKVKRLRCFEDISVGVSFGQREDLVTRIKGLLKAYPCDSSIMKELLQNADDAGATEIHFVKDYRAHSTERLFQSSCEVLQGPSLCVYNNSCFTKKDIEGIHNLGRGSKSDDPTKTGQYGVGFNAVYHLTDTPSFVTIGPDDADNCLFIFDPLCQHVPKATALEPGIMCKLEDLENNFSDHIVGFSLSDLMESDVGTVFRFPLRSTSSEISDEEISTSKMDNILLSFQDDMFECVLFLKNVSSIRISNITSGGLIEEYAVKTELSESARRDRNTFNKNVDTITKQNIKRRANNFEIDPLEVTYQIAVTDNHYYEHWMIIQRFGFTGTETVDHLDELKQYLNNGDLGLSPFGGVAIRLRDGLKKTISAIEKPVSSQDSGRSYPKNVFEEENLTVNSETTRSKTFLGKLFCFLPLPVTTGLPVHVNGHFALDHEARRDLWKDGYRNKWNTCVVNAVIIPAWISGLLHIRDIITKITKPSQKIRVLHSLLSEFHFYFPIHNCTSDFWNNLVDCFYKYIVRERIELFSCVIDTKLETETLGGTKALSKEERLCTVWTVVEETPPDGVFSGIFDTIHTEMEKVHFAKMRDTYLIKNLLKTFGMKLLETPNSIREAMEKAGIKQIPTSTPSQVISFLKTFSSAKETRCEIGPVGFHISETKYLTSNNLRVLLNFLMLDESFNKKMEGLPVLLTADGKIRICSENAPVFLSKYSKLLPKCEHLFVHEDILPLFREPKNINCNILKGFDFEDFVRLLPNNLDIELYGNGSEVKLTENGEEHCPSISQQLLTLLYDFLGECSCQTSEDKKANTSFRIDTDILTGNIKKVEKWSFLPSVHVNGNVVLIPFSETTHVLYLSYGDKLDGVGKSINKFYLPELYGKAFVHCQKNREVTKSMENIVASLGRPYDLLQCLAYHKNTLQTTADINETDAVEILGFFGRNLKVLEQYDKTNSIVKTLRQLPLYLTQQGTITDIASTEEVLVLPKGMPFHGIQTWADKCHITLLQEKDALGSLYGFLGLQKADIMDVYGQKILPRFSAIPQKYWMEHIEYIRDRIGHKRVLTGNELKIVSELKKVAFVSVSGEMKRPNQLFDPCDTVFKHMVKPCECLPEDLLSSEWRQFLIKLDLICDVTDELMLRFARTLQSEYSQVPLESIHKKSRALLSRFCKNNGTQWERGTISKIRTVRFIEHHPIETEYTDVCKQYSDHESLICFNDAVSSNHMRLCWSSITLISNDLCQKLNKDVRINLGIQEKPPVNKVVIHCENVCDSFKRKLSTNTVSDSFVKNQMLCFYEFFGENCETLSREVKSKIQMKPFIHIPEDKDIVFISEVVIDLPSGLEIKPYLYKAPTYYGKYFDLFKVLGCETKVMFCHYASVLQKVKEKCTESVMDVSERAIVRTAFRGLIHIDTGSDSSVQEVQDVFLPTQEMILKNSRDIIVSNEPSFEQRLKGNITLDLCAGKSFLDLKISSFSFEDVFSKWRADLRPDLLADVIEEEVCMEEGSAQRIVNSLKASKIKAFLRSGELVTGLCRLIKHQCTDGNSKKNFNGERTETEVRTRLHNITVVEVSALRTVLKYKGNAVQGSERNIAYHITKSSNLPNSFYFKDTSRTRKVEVTNILHGIVRLLKMCASGLNAESVVHVTLLIQEIETPQKIPTILDGLQIKQYGESHASYDYFPKPGTYVESHFVPFLVQGISPFKDYEYDCVAMELEDVSEDMEGDSGLTPVFIYVRIIQEVSISVGTDDLRRTYIVETGNANIPSEEVPIYRLYRFVRREINPTREVQVSTGEQRQQQIPVDKQCKLIRDALIQAWKLPEKDRKRVVRRILLEWHPDKNRENEKYCTKVFQYIQIILSRLENGEILIDDVQEEMSRGKSKYSQSSARFYENVFRRARSYARAYYDNFDDYSRSERTGSYAHSSSSRIIRPDHEEAKRWFRQAKNDFLAAQDMVPSANGISSFNWVCYICHQACEKALKAVHYSKDANNIPESIFLPALALTADMQQQATLLEARLGQHGRLRYPDPLTRPRIPSDMYTRDDAEFSLEATRKILELVEEYIE